MTIRVPLDGDNWADVKTPAEIMGSDIDRWEEFIEGVRDDALGPEPAPVPDPENPAVMKVPERRGSFKASHVHQMRDELLTIVVTAWSYGLPLPYAAEHRSSIPGPSCRKMYKAADPVRKLLNDEEDDEGEPDPKPESGSTGSGGSADTSPESTGSPLPE